MTLADTRPDTATAQPARNTTRRVLANALHGRENLSTGMAALYLLAAMAGAGIVSLPRAMANTGWGGLLLLVVLSLAAGFAGTRLGMCWVLLEECWPEYRDVYSRPYMAIVRRAFGNHGQIAAEMLLVFTFFGVSTVYLLLASQTIFSLLIDLHSLRHCHWVLIIGGILCPITWLSAHKDVWVTQIMALLCSLLACVVVVVEVLMQRDTHPPPVFEPPTFKSMFLGYGAILYALGGASFFPTVQNHMKDRSKFPHSVVIAFLGLLVLYLPVSSICYGFLGNSEMPSNILNAVSGIAVSVTQSFLFGYFLYAFAVTINPVYQAFEDAFKIPNKFGMRRAALRTCVMAVVLLVALTIPDFNKVLCLVGGSAVTLVSFVLSPLCYLCLCATIGPDGTPCRVLPMGELVVLWVIVVVGLLGGVAATWSALTNIIFEQSFGGTCFSPGSFAA